MCVSINAEDFKGDHELPRIHGFGTTLPRQQQRLMAAWFNRPGMPRVSWARRSSASAAKIAFRFSARSTDGVGQVVYRLLSTPAFKRGPYHKPLPQRRQLRTPQGG